MSSFRRSLIEELSHAAAKELGEAAFSQPVDQAACGRLADDQPPLGLGVSLDRVQHHRLASAASPGVQGRAAAGTRTVGQRVGELCDHLVAAREQRGVGAEGRLERVLHPTHRSNPFRPL